VRPAAPGCVFDGFEDELLARVKIHIGTAAPGANRDNLVGLYDNPTGEASRRYRNHDELHCGMFRFCSFGRVGEGLLKGGFDDPMESPDSHPHARDWAAGGASLNCLDNAIAHAKFMHLASAPRRRGIEP
jgi:hypothetical protein